MSDSKNIIHIRIRDLRRERSLTQEELAEALGISRQSINAMEAGRCLPSLPIALDIASFFAVPIHYLIEQAEAEAAQQQVAAPWSPLQEMRHMLDGMMDETRSLAPVANATMPAVNVSQTKDEVHVDLHLPGYKKEDIAVEVGEDFLTVSGEAVEEDMSDKQYFRREFVSQSFTRTLPLPAIVQQDGATADMKHGVLHIKLRKQAEEKPKTSRIQIQSEE